MATCDTDELVDSAKCYCFADGDLDAILIYLLCEWANVEG